MFLKLSNRHPRRILVVEFNPYRILAAEITLPRRGPMILVSAAEFNRHDTDGLRRWLDANADGAKTRATAICGLVPNRGFVRRESVRPARLAEPGYLEEFVEEQQKGRFLTATPFKIAKASAWTFRAVSAVDGTPLPVSGPARPALICAMARDEVLAAQERLLENRLIRGRIEPGLLSLFGAVYANIERRGGTQAVVVVVIHQSATAVYILGKEGVTTPNPVLHGLNSIIEMGRKELDEIDEAEVLAELQIGNPELVNHAGKLVRRIGRDLKPVVDSFEMTTGQPVDEILCAYLPSNLNWIAEPLARSAGRTPLIMDCAEWLPTIGLQVVDGGPTFALHWLGALSLVAKLPEVSGLQSKRNAAEHPSYHRPWHVDCSVPMASDGGKFAGRRFLTNVLSSTLAVFAIVVTAWQLYALYSLRADTLYWEKQLADNGTLFKELNTASATLKSQSAVLDRAYEMMGESYQLSHLILDLGRTLPARMRIDRIETNDVRVAISGALLEPAEEVSSTLGRHMDDIRRHHELGPLFSNVAITSLQRDADSDVVVFELTLRFNRSTP